MIQPGEGHTSPRVGQPCAITLLQLPEPDDSSPPMFRIWVNQPEHPGRKELICNVQDEGGFPVPRVVVSALSICSLSLHCLGSDTLPINLPCRAHSVAEFAGLPCNDPLQIWGRKFPCIFALC